MEKCGKFLVGQMKALIIFNHLFDLDGKKRERKLADRKVVYRHNRTVQKLIFQVKQSAQK